MHSASGHRAYVPVRIYYMYSPLDELIAAPIIAHVMHYCKSNNLTYMYIQPNRTGYEIYLSILFLPYCIERFWLIFWKFVTYQPVLTR